MKIIFLDIDGVVNCSTTAQRHRGFIGVDPYMALLVGRIVEATGAKIVLSSSWRHFPDGREEVERQVMPVLDVTPSMPDLFNSDGKVVYERRGREIQFWLDQHPEVTKYAILDDDTDMLPYQKHFKTTWAEGLTEKIANDVINYLNS